MPLSKFESFQHSPSENSKGEVEELRIFKLENEGSGGVSKYEFSQLKRPGQGDYDHIKSKMGSLAITDDEFKNKKRTDRNFSLHAVVKDKLAIGEEESRAVSELVDSQVKKIEKEVREAARKEGFDSGFEQGRKDAIQKFKEESQSHLERLNAFLESCEGAKTEIFQENEKFLIDLVFQISKTLLLKELKEDREYVSRLARDVIEKIGVKENITLKISPEEQESISFLKEDLTQTLGEMRNFNIEVGSHIQMGGCEIETEWNSIDARIETQLAGINQSLTGKTSSE